jgi:hypothetical protein
MLEKINNVVWTVAITMSIMAGTVCLFDHQYKRMDKYAIEHNCKWDYNDMCYTREQRPWLFNND